MPYCFKPFGLLAAAERTTPIEAWSPPEALGRCNITTEIGHDAETRRAETAHYNAMIHPFHRMTIKGIIWYQGLNET